MSEKTLKFDDVDRKEFHASKQPTYISSVEINDIVISDKLEHNEKGVMVFLPMRVMTLLELYVLYCLR